VAGSTDQANTFLFFYGMAVNINHKGSRREFRELGFGFWEITQEPIIQVFGSHISVLMVCDKQRHQSLGL
jgi:hypothetical protein